MASRQNLNRMKPKNIVTVSYEIKQAHGFHTEQLNVTRSGEIQEDFADSSEVSECESTDSDFLDEIGIGTLRYLRIKIYKLRAVYDSKPLPFKIISLSISFLLLVSLAGLYMKFSAPLHLWRDDLHLILRKYPALSVSDRSAIVFTFHEVLENKNGEFDGFLTKTILFSGQNADKLLRELQRFVRNHFNPDVREPIPLDQSTMRAYLHDKVESGINSSKHGPGLMSLLGIDKMHWDAPLVLHAFCDPDVNNNGNRVNLLSMSQVTKNKRACEEQTHRVLTNNWTATGGNADNIPPILSRIDFVICL